MSLESELKRFDRLLLDRSYINGGPKPTKSDLEALKAVQKLEGRFKDLGLQNTSRWIRHIKSFESNEFESDEQKAEKITFKNHLIDEVRF